MREHHMKRVSNGMRAFVLTVVALGFAFPTTATSQSIAFLDPNEGEIFGVYPVEIDAVFSPANVLQSLTGVLELFNIPLGLLNEDTATTGSMHVTARLIEGNNLLRLCLNNSVQDVHCDRVNIDWQPATGDWNGDRFVNIADNNALILAILNNQPYRAVVDMQGDGFNNILDVVLISLLIQTCTPPATNIAVGGSAAMSSVCVGTPSLAVDGIIDGNISGGNVVQNCSGDSPPYFEVTFAERFELDRVILFNRTDSNSGNLADLRLQVFDGPTLVYTHGALLNPNNTLGGPSSIDTSIAATIGDRVRITKVAPMTNGDVFALTEMQVFGLPAFTACRLEDQYLLYYGMDEGPLGSTSSSSPGGILDSGSDSLHANNAGTLSYVGGDPTQGGAGNLGFRFTGAAGQEIVLENAVRTTHLDFDYWSSFTLEAAIKTTAHSGTAYGALIANDNGGGPGFFLRINNGYVECQITDVAGIVARALTTVRVNDGRWHTVTCIRDGIANELQVYIDRLLNVTVSDGTTSSLANNSSMRLGRFNNGSYRFTGDYDFALLANFVIDPTDQPISLPYYEPFTTDPGFQVIDDGDVSGPSRWRIDTMGWNATNAVMIENTNIYCSGASPPGCPEGVGTYGQLGTLNHYGDETWENYNAGVFIYTPDNDAVGIIARYQDEDNYYRFSVDRERNRARLVARVNGFSNEIAPQVAHQYNMEEWMHLSIEVDGSTITGRYNGVTLLTGFDGRLTSGEVGLYDWGSSGTGGGYGNSVAWDGLSVTATGTWQLPYTDDMSVDRGWTIVDDFANSTSEWGPVAGYFRQRRNSGGGGGSYGTIAVHGDLRWTSYRFNARVRSTDNDSLGIIVRYTDPGNYYRFYINAQNRITRLSRYVNGVHTSLGTFAWTYTPWSGPWYDIGLEARGTTINAYIGQVQATPVISVTDSSHAHGGIGLYSWYNSQSQFDDINVIAVPCGDMICDVAAGETLGTCPDDCTVCGDGLCSAPFEDRASCLLDCWVCGDDTCDSAYENTTNCRALVTYTANPPHFPGGLTGDCCAIDNDCDDSNLCTDSICNPGTFQCSSGYNTASCNDSNQCTHTDACSAGACSGITITCNDDPAPPASCGMTRTCNGTANCTETPYPAGSACDDGLFCNGTDRCDGAGSSTSCSVHSGDPCTGGTQCADSCNDVANNCFDLLGASCNDGRSCTYADSCNGAGACTNSRAYTCSTTPFSTALGDDRCSRAGNGWTPAGGLTCGSNTWLGQLDDNRTWNFGEIAYARGNCEMGGAGDAEQWFRFYARDLIAEDDADNGDAWGVNMYFERNDEDTFEFRVFTERFSTNICGDPGARGCKGWTSSSGTGDWPGAVGDVNCTFEESYEQDFYQDPCDHHHRNVPIGWNYCEDNDTYYWIRVTMRPGAVCNACQTFVLRANNGNTCPSPAACAPGFSCVTPTDTYLGITYTHPPRCWPNSPMNPIDVGRISDGLRGTGGSYQTRSGTCPEAYGDGVWYTFEAVDDNRLDGAHHGDNWMPRVYFTVNDQGRFRHRVFCDDSSANCNTNYLASPVPGPASSPPVPYGTSYTRDHQQEPCSGALDWTAPHHCVDDTMRLWVLVDFDPASGACPGPPNDDYSIRFRNDYE
jgi:hypothetical protein